MSLSNFFDALITFDIPTNTRTLFIFIAVVFFGTGVVLVSRARSGMLVVGMTLILLIGVSFSYDKLAYNYIVQFDKSDCHLNEEADYLTIIPMSPPSAVVPFLPGGDRFDKLHCDTYQSIIDERASTSALITEILLLTLFGILSALTGISATLVIRLFPVNIWKLFWSELKELFGKISK